MPSQYFNQTLLYTARFLYETLPPTLKAPQTLNLTNYHITSGFLFAYQQSKEYWYLQAALAHIQAYLELGYSNPQNILLFQEILSISGITYSDFIKNIALPSEQVHPTYSRLNSILGKWPASKHNSHKKPEAIQDILYHIKHLEIGEYQYSVHNERQSKLFRLIITSSSARLYDYHSCRAYSFYIT